MTELLDNITARLQEPETQETVGKFLSVLSGFVKSKGEINVTDKGAFAFRVVDGAPQLTVSREFLENLGEHGLVLHLDSPATNDVVARLGQVDNTVISFNFDGVDYHPNVSHVIISKQPLHMQQMLKRKTLSQDEFNIVKEYLISKSLNFDVVENDESDHEVTSEEHRRMYGDVDDEDQVLPEDIKRLLKPKKSEEEEMPPRSEKKIVVPESDDEEEEPAPRPRSEKKIVVPESDDEEDEPATQKKKGVRKATTIRVDSEDDEKKEEDEAEKTSKSVNISFFRKRRDGSRDKTVGRIGKYVFRLNKRVKDGKTITDLICIGRYDAKVRGIADLTPTEIEDVKKRGYTLASKYQ